MCDISQANLAPNLLQHLEDVVKVIARGLREDVLSSTFEYTGNNAISK